MPGTTQLECKVKIIQPTLCADIKQNNARVMMPSPRRSVKQHFAEAFKIQNVNYNFVVFISIEWGVVEDRKQCTQYSLHFVIF